MFIAKILKPRKNKLLKSTLIKRLQSIKLITLYIFQRKVVIMLSLNNYYYKEKIYIESRKLK